MRIALIADVFPPLRSSGAVQLRDLAAEFRRQDHQVTVFLPDSTLFSGWELNQENGYDVIRVKSPAAKDKGNIGRAISETLMPFSMIYYLRKCPNAMLKFDGVIWYSPSIFLGPVASWLKKNSQCRSYLIIRDIFPEWARDMGILNWGLPYLFFKFVARFQYTVADTIGVQTPGNFSYFGPTVLLKNQRVEVLHNWLSNPVDSGCRIDISSTTLAGRKIFVYAGNMGLAQGIGILLDLADKLKDDRRVGFVFVGRGSEIIRIRNEISRRHLTNVLLFDEVDPDEISGLYAQCHVGLVSLDIRHKTHNIPGKFISYMHSGLPVLASINPGNDLVALIADNGVGRTVTDGSGERLYFEALEMISDSDWNEKVSSRCLDLAHKLFSVENTVRQLIGVFQSAPN